MNYMYFAVVTRPHYSIICLVVVFILAVVPVTQAQSEEQPEQATQTELGRPEEKPAPANRANVGGQRSAEERQQQQAALSKRTQDRIIKLVANVSNRLDAVIVRFTNISGRLERRIEKQKGLGADTATATQALTQAQALIDEAKAGMATIDSVVFAAVTSEDPRQAWPAVREQLRSVRNDLQSVRVALQRTIAALTTVPPAEDDPAADTSTE